MGTIRCSANRKMSTALPVLLFHTFVLYLTFGQWNLIHLWRNSRSCLSWDHWDGQRGAQDFGEVFHIFISVRKERTQSTVGERWM
ncbi:hypothetical protein BGY98DRAFT_944246 [Russula aff. rugulosa BPL654]|nr:hypothetical protein BGY98DRAFT_944246 [Russula aff. rugulosa BPL654]